MNWMFATGFQFVNLILALGVIGLWVYVLILLIKFLRTGTLAFQKYLESNKDE